MADCEHKKASVESTETDVTLTCDSCGEVLRQHSTAHVLFARKFYANAPDDGWILKHCPMELKFMEDFSRDQPRLG
jgi:hypothetical protein